MKNSNNENNIPLTTGKALLNDWQALRNIIAQITCTQKEKQEKVNEDSAHFFKLLSDTQIDDAFHGPFHPLIHHLTHAYSLITQIRTRLIVTQDDNLKSRVQDSGFDLPEGLNKEINAASLDKKQRELDEAARHQFQQWRELIGKWQQNFVMQITTSGITLSEGEINEIQQTEPVSELINRFTDLKLEAPKMKKQNYTLNDYLNLKIILIVHSALSRQHITNIDAELQKLLKQLKPHFKTLSQEENELIKQQDTEIKTLMKF